MKQHIIVIRIITIQGLWWFNWPKIYNCLTILFTSIKIHNNVPVITINISFHFVLFVFFVLNVHFILVLFVPFSLFLSFFVLLVFRLRKRQKGQCHPPPPVIASNYHWFDGLIFSVEWNNETNFTGEFS